MAFINAAQKIYRRYAVANSLSREEQIIDPFKAPLFAEQYRIELDRGVVVDNGLMVVLKIRFSLFSLLFWDRSCLVNQFQEYIKVFVKQRKRSAVQFRGHLHITMGF